jgi:hypothetical protein
MEMNKENTELQTQIFQFLISEEETNNKEKRIKQDGQTEAKEATQGQDHLQGQVYQAPNKGYPIS